MQKHRLFSVIYKTNLKPSPKKVQLVSNDVAQVITNIEERFNAGENFTHF